MITPLFKKIIILVGLGITPILFADPSNNPCNDTFLNIVDRPSAGDSVCTVPLNKLVLEAGTQYLQLTQPGQQLNLPQAVLRFGLPQLNEIEITTPNYISQNNGQSSGTASSTIGIKHQLGYNSTWITAVESIFTLPTGSSSLGSDGLGISVNGIVSYSITSKLGLTFMFGVSSQTLAQAEGGQRFSSINPDLVISYLAQEKFSLYGEIYGQSNTGPGQGNGFNLDTGFLYLYLPNVTFDAEIGQRINGDLGGLSRYVGVGFALML